MSSESAELFKTLLTCWSTVYTSVDLVFYFHLVREMQRKEREGREEERKREREREGGREKERQRERGGVVGVAGSSH